MNDRSVKVCIIGNSGVGKTALAIRFTANTFTTGNVSTLGAALCIGRHTYNERLYKFLIWDTAGQEQYNSVVPMFYRSAEAAVIVYDITCKKSFQAIERWYQQTQTTQNYKFKTFIICGNKSDLDHNRVVSQEDGQKVARKLNAIHIESSALENTNVKEIFEGIAAVIEKADNYAPSTQVPTDEETNMVVAADADRKKKRQCC